jgi:hypothetical protein
VTRLCRELLNALLIALGILSAGMGAEGGVVKRATLHS